MDQIIINADDFGMSLSVNEGIDYCFKYGLIDRTSIMVNMPLFDEACELAMKNGYYDRIGLHLNLVEGTPLSESIKRTSFCNKNGEFNGSAMSKKINRIYLEKSTQIAIIEEVDAQCRRYVNCGFSLSHLDSHRHVHTNPSILRLVLPIANQYGFHSIRLSRNIPAKEISFVKRLLKETVNSKILKYNKINGNDFMITDFGSMNDVDKSLPIHSDHIIEMMVHPIMKDNILLEAMGGMNLNQWWNKETHK